MAQPPQSSSVLSTRVSFDTRANFAALASHYQLSESSFLSKLIDDALTAHSTTTRMASERGSPDAAIHGVATDRITLRLRPGDRALAAVRADARGTKTCSYLAMLIHNHVRGPAVLPPRELDQIRVACAHLAALGRQLRMFGAPNMSATPMAFTLNSELSEAIAQVRREVEVAREATAAVVRWNLRSWGTDREPSHAQTTGAIDAK
ncbi:hypothetical protein ABIC33_006478 [Variovorax sp. 1140]|uniref:hypothetical protein n=1 Tax=Variovorax atrisoli TaxID=3394203 RepID=UPI003393B1DC